jgi:hypothetical protein
MGAPAESVTRPVITACAKAPLGTAAMQARIASVLIVVAERCGKPSRGSNDRHLGICCVGSSSIGIIDSSIEQPLRASRLIRICRKQLTRVQLDTLTRARFEARPFLLNQEEWML